MRRLNCSLRRSSRCCLSSSADLVVRSLMAISHHRPGHELGLHRELGGGQAERLACRRLVDALDFIQHAAGLDRGDPELDAALARAHAHFDRLLGDRLVREHADPQLAATLDKAGDATTSRLDLARGERTMRGRLQAVLAEADEVGALGQTVVAAFELLAVLGSLGLQHGNSPLLRRPLATAFTGLATRIITTAFATFTARRRRFVLRLLAGSGQIEDLALVHPDLDADDAVGGARLGETVVDVGAQRMQRHATLAAPLGAGDLGAVQAAGDVDLDAQGAQAHRVADRALHRAAEHDAALQLLRDGLCHQLRVQLGLAHLVDVDVRRDAHHVADFLAQLLDVLALLADHHARAGSVDRHARGLGRALDLDLRDAGGGQLLLQHVADLDVGHEILGVIALVGEPLRVPVLGNAEADTGGMNFMTHRLYPQSVADNHSDVAGTFQDARTAALGAGVHALHRRTFVDEDAGHLQLVDVGTEIVLGVGDGRQQHLANQVRSLLVGIGEHVAGPAHGKPADEVGHQACLLRRNAGAAQDRFGFSAHHLPFLSPTWPLNVRVTANSPSLCPTMFSLIRTGTC